MAKDIKSVSHHDRLIESLKDDPEFAEEYLNAAFEEEDPKYFLKALRNVVEALYGMTEASKKTKLNRVTLYRILSDSGNPRWESIFDLIKAIGFRFAMKRAA